MTPSETCRAAKVMLDSLKPGAILFRHGKFHGYAINEWRKSKKHQREWDWDLYDYCVRLPKPKRKEKK